MEAYAEGVRKNGGDEQRYCEELKKRGAPQWIFPWLLRQKIYERSIPESILRAALEYLERDPDRELGGFDDALRHVFSLGFRSIVESLGFEEELRRIYPSAEGRDKEAEKGRGELEFLEPLLGERNSSYFLELIFNWFLKSLEEGKENVNVREAIEEMGRYSRALLERVGKILLVEKIGKLSDEETQKILGGAMENYGTNDKKVVYRRLAKDVLTMSPEELRNCIDKTYDKKSKTFMARGEMIGSAYFKICKVLGLLPRSKHVSRGNLLKALLKSKEEQDESTTPGTYLNGESLRKIFTEELQFYEMLENEAFRIYNSWESDESKKDWRKNANLKKLFKETVEKLYNQEKPPLRHLRSLITKEDFSYALEQWFDSFLNTVYVPTENEMKKLLQHLENHLKKAIKMLNKQWATHVSDNERQEILKRAKDKYQTKYIDGSNGILTHLSKDLGVTYSKLHNIWHQGIRLQRGLHLKIYDVLNFRHPENIRVSKEELYVALLKAGKRMKRQEKPEAKMKYLKDIVELNDFKYIIEIVATGFLPKLPMTIDEKETEKMAKVVETAIKYFEKRLEHVVEILLNERIEKLSDDEIIHITHMAKNKYKHKRKESGKRAQREQEGFAPWAIRLLANELGIRESKFKNCYFPGNWNSRERMTVYTYLRICDALKLGSTEREFKRVSRETLVKAFLEAEKRLTRKEQEAFLDMDRDQQLLHHWSKQQSGTNCIFFGKDLQILKKIALRKYASKTELARRLVEMGIGYTTRNTVARLTKSKTTDVELVLALIGVTIDRLPEEVIQLIQNGELAEEFKNSLRTQELIDEKDSEWLSNLPKDLVREVSLESLAEEFRKEITTPDEAIKFLKSLVNQNIINKKFSANLHREELNKLKDALNKMKKEGNIKDIYLYIAEKLNEHLQKGEKVTKRTIYAELGGKGLESGEHRMNMKRYLLMCKILNVEPNLELHFRTTESFTHYTRIKTAEVDFPWTAMYRDHSGKKIIIVENENKFFVVVDDRWLPAEKWKTRYGGEWWGLTIIDYETEEGVYTVAKEIGELWPPHTRPWYTQQTSRALIGFKTIQQIKNLIRTILDKTSLSLKSLIKITGISTLKGLLKGSKREENFINMCHLLTLLGLKTMLTQTDMIKEIREYEKEIDTMSGREIPEERKRNILYINLKTLVGARLIGHTLGDGNLFREANRISFAYTNTELEYLEAFGECLNFYGYPSNLHRIMGKHKTAYRITAGGFLGYALWCAIPKATGRKSLNNPKVPSWITDAPRLAKPFLQAIISDEANIDPKAKIIEIISAVDVTEILNKKGFEQVIRNIVEDLLTKLQEKWNSLGKLNEEQKQEQENEEHSARMVSTSRVLKEMNGKETVRAAKEVPCNILLGVKKAFQTLEINTRKEKMVRFFVSKTGAITAIWRISLSSEGTRKAYENHLIKGYKKQRYEQTYKEIWERVRIEDKLSKEQMAELENMYKKRGMKSEKKISLSKIKKYWNSKLYGDIMEIINKIKPKSIKKKEIELEKRGINAQTKPVSIYVGKVISVEWELYWFELHRESE